MKLLVDLWQEAYVKANSSDELYDELRGLLLTYLRPIDGIAKKEIKERDRQIEAL